MLDKVSNLATSIEDLPERFNAAQDILALALRDRPDHAAYICDGTTWSYRALADRVDRFAGLLAELGIEQEQRILLCLHDTIDFPTAFLGAIKAGVIPIPVNTLFSRDVYAYQLNDSRAKLAIVSAECADRFDDIQGQCPGLKRVVVAGAGDDGLDALLRSARPRADPAATRRDEPAFWLYTSGSTGNPKGVVHAHGSMRLTANLYGQGVLGIEPDDVVHSTAKLFFAYGLGNSLTFPLSVGAAVVLHPGRSTPQAVNAALRRWGVSVLNGSPTFFGAFLAQPDCPERADLPRLRRVTSAGEALPAHLAERFQTRFGLDILDGIGSTEMLHIFISQRVDDVHHGITGKPVPGYQAKILDDHGQPVRPGEIGDLYVRGPTSALGYWANRAKTRQTFVGEWTRTGDKYLQDADGYYRYAGRSDDMLKVSGIYVSPFDVEEALVGHPSVLEAAVIGYEDEQGLIKPKAFIVLQANVEASADLEAILKALVKQKLAPHAYPRWIEFVDSLPKTATGKIQRFKLREAAGASAGAEQA